MFYFLILPCIFRAVIYFGSGWFCLFHLTKKTTTTKKWWWWRRYVFSYALDCLHSRVRGLSLKNNSICELTLCICGRISSKQKMGNASSLAWTLIQQWTGQSLPLISLAHYGYITPRHLTLSHLWPVILDLLFTRIRKKKLYATSLFTKREKKLFLAWP